MSLYVGIKKELAKSSASAYLVLFANLISGFLFQTIVLRYLKPEEAGFYFTFLSIAYLLNMVLNLGVVSGLQYFLPKGKEKKAYLSTSFIYSLLSSSLIGFLIFLMNIRTPYALLACISAVNMLLAGSLLTALHLAKMFRFRTFTAFAQGFAKLGVVLLAFLGGSFNLFYAFIALFTSTFLTTILSIYKLVKENLLSLTFSKKHLIDLIKVGFPLYLVTMSESVLGWVDTFFLSLFKGNIDVARYNAVLTIIKNTFVIVIPMLAFSALPVITPLTKKQREKVDIWLFKLGILFTLFILFYFLYTSYDIINILYPKYLNAVDLLLFGLICFLPLPIAKFMMRMSIADGKTDHLTMPALLLIFFNIFLNAFLIPHFGVYGALTATGLSILIFTVGILKGHHYSFPSLRWVLRYAIILGFSLIISFNVFNETGNAFVEKLTLLIIKTVLFVLAFLILWLIASPEEDKRMAENLVKGSLTFFKNRFNK